MVKNKFLYSGCLNLNRLFNGCLKLIFPCSKLEGLILTIINRCKHPKFLKNQMKKLLQLISKHYITMAVISMSAQNIHVSSIAQIKQHMSLWQKYSRHSHKINTQSENCCWKPIYSPVLGTGRYANATEIMFSSKVSPV